ncbi:tetratricopeptide repeat-containing sensor histidine kinase [Aquimarina megaterium]|uniref:tetratricopeptide repeat-containing sensor histidine kinase n=1 Tax=Aquimarina megaterium TaxID=1443666 RepID=UPI000942161F|nr:ATP-binding protein [Aquimarina megaterium]
MKLSKTNILYITVVCFFLSCTNSSHSNKSKEYVKNDSIHSLYLKAKNTIFSKEERLGFLDKAQRFSEQLLDTTSLLNIYSLKNAIYSDPKLPDSTLFYAKSMLNLAINKQDTSKIAKAYFKIAKYYNSKSKYDSAYYYYNFSKEKYLSMNDSSQVGKKLMAMARILLDDDDYYESETTSVEALKYLSPIKDKKYIASTYHNLSMSSRKQLDNDKALEQINVALKLAQSPRDRNLYINSKALTLREKKEYNKAIRLYDSILRNISISKNKKEYARVIDNLAYTQWLSNNSLDVEYKLIEALNIRKSKNDVQGLIASHSHLMKYYTKKNTEKAIEHAKSLYILTVEQNNIKDRLDALTYLRNLSSIQGSKVYSDLYIKIKDSITKARDIAKNKYAIIRYDSTKDREETLRLEAQLSKSDLLKSKYQIQKLVLAILVLIVSSIGIFINRYRKHQAKIALIKERHTTEKRISKKLHDEVGNDIFYLATQLQQDPGFTTNPDKLKILKGFDSVYHKVRDISRDHTVETGEEYGDEVLSLLNSYGSQTTKVITNTLDADFWSSVSAYKKGELYWVLKELLTNMKKHSKASFVSVQFLKEKQHLVVTYVDNGIGINDKHLISKNGLRNVENRMKDIKGTITFESEPKQGFKAKIVFTS